MWTQISRLRHGPLRSFEGLWRGAGRAYRGVQSATGLPRAVAKRIGPYGPFRLNGRFAFSNFEAWGGRHNAGFAACVELSRGRRCVLDIGAHIGLVALPVSQVLAPGGRVYAFEPAAGNLRYLRDHVALNDLDNVEVLDLLVGRDERRAVSFYENLGDSGLNSLAPRAADAGFVESARDQVSIDSFCHARDLRPDLLKIDVEGAEVGVLAGGRQVLATVRPPIVLSVHPRQMGELGDSVEALSQLIAEFGYVVTTADGVAASELAFDEYILHPRERDQAC